MRPPDRLPGMKDKIKGMFGINESSDIDRIKSLTSRVLRG